MGCGWYSFKAICSGSYAIAVTNKDIKESHKIGSSNSQKDEDGEERFDDLLKAEEINWLLDQAKGFKLYEIGHSIVLFMKENSEIVSLPKVSVPGPYEIDGKYYFLECEIHQAPDGVEYNELFEIARKLTPKENKLSFPPGRYCFSGTSSIYVNELQEEEVVPVDDESTDNDEQEDDEEEEATTAGAKKKDPESQECKPSNDTNIPRDFELVVGKGDKRKTLSTCKAILSCYFPGFDAAGNANKLELPDLDPAAVQLVLDAYTTRKNVDMPRSWGRGSKLFSAVQLVLEKFGLDKGEPQDKKAKTDHPALSDPRWLDTTFVAGPNQEEIKANRVVLASMNPVLCRILFGTGVLTVDPCKPIQWPEFDATAVRQVLQALVHRGKHEFVVPVESVVSAKALVDYLMETRRGLNLYYDTPFKRNLQCGFRLNQSEDSEGFVLN